MNKTLTINLGGFVFHIDETAYDILSKYLQALKGYFSNPETRDEIVSDVEARMAELFRAELGKNREVIGIDDVNKVISILGNPEDFGGDTEPNKANQPFSNPQAFDYTNQSRRRVFRDPDDKVVGGVCSGLANYFGFDPLWLRLGWVISLFFFGMGFLLYFVLWIIIPKAVTTADKLEMRGEPVNLQNIEKQVMEEMKDFEERAKEFGKDAKTWGRNAPQGPAGRFFNDFFRLLGLIIVKFFSLIGKIIGGFFLFLACAVGFAFLAILFGSMDFIQVNINQQDFGINLHDLLSRIFVSDLDQNLFLGALAFFSFIPLTLLVYWAIRILFKVKRGNLIPWVVTGLFLSGIILLVFPLRNLKKDTKTLYVDKSQIKIKNSDTLYIETDPKTDAIMTNGFNDNEDLNFVGNWKIMVDNETPSLVGVTRLDIVKSPTDSTWIEVVRSAKGFDKEAAGRRAKSIDYGISQRDSLLVVNGHFNLADNEQLRHQKLRVILHLGQGKTIYLNKSIEPIIYDIKNVTNTYDSDMLGHYWTMTMDGLACPDFRKTDEPSEEDSEDLGDAKEWDNADGSHTIEIENITSNSKSVIIDDKGDKTEIVEKHLGNGTKEITVKKWDKKGKLKTETINVVKDEQVEIPELPTPPTPSKGKGEKKKEVKVIVR